MTSEVEFDTDLADSTRASRDAERSGSAGASGKGLAGWLIRHGIAKDERQAVVILTALIVIDILIIVGAWKLGARAPSNAPRPITPVSAPHH